MGSVKRKKRQTVSPDTVYPVLPEAEDEDYYGAQNADAASEGDDPPRKTLRARWFSSGFTKLALALLLALAGLVLAVYCVLAIQLQNALTVRVNTAVEFLQLYERDGLSAMQTHGKAYVSAFSDRTEAEMQLLSPQGEVLASASGLSEAELPESAEWRSALTDDQCHVFRGKVSHGDRMIAVTRSVSAADGEVVFLIRCVSGMQAMERETLCCAAVGGAAALFILLCVVLSNARFIRSIVDPLQQITETANQIAKGKYGVHIVPVYPYEIGALCDTINDMSDAISQAERTKNEFISSVSHELRTPLTAIAGWSETLLTGTDYGRDGQESEVYRGLEIIRGEASRLSGMVEELLDFSRMENGELNMQMAPLELAEDIEDVVFMYMDPLNREGIQLEFHEDDELPLIVGDRARLRQVFLNILENAKKHGGSGGRIIVQLTAGDGMFYVTVRDFGQGIPPEELPHVKERFYKGSSKASGSGIGLAMADEIIRLHGGRLDISSALGEGTAVTISLPAAEGAQMSDDTVLL